MTDKRNDDYAEIQTLLKKIEVALGSEGFSTSGLIDWTEVKAILAKINQLEMIMKLQLKAKLVGDTHVGLFAHDNYCLAVIHSDDLDELREIFTDLKELQGRSSGHRDYVPVNLEYDKDQIES